MKKYFNVNDPNKIVTILKSDDSFIHLSDGTMIKFDKFEQKYQPVIGNDKILENNTNTQNNVLNNDQVDPEQFFNSSGVSKYANDIKKMDTSKISDVPQQTVVNNNQSYMSNDSAVTIKKDEKLDEIERIFENEKLAYGEDEANKRRLGRIAQYQGIGQKKSTTQVNVNGQEQVQTNIQIQPPIQPQIDPTEMMFKSFKRNFEINININIKDKIANPDFVKMMMENMEGDIIGYYKKLIMNNIMSDIQVIEKEVEHSIKTAIYGDDIHEEEKEIDNSTSDELVKESTDITNTLQEHVNNGDEINILVEGKPTKSGKKTYKYIDDKGKVKDLLPETAIKKGYKPFEKSK